MRDRIAWQIVDALHDLAVANHIDFVKRPGLSELWLANLREGLHVYVSDKVTCGWLDCWSTYKDLIDRYQKQGVRGPVLQDCEDAACSWAGWMTANCFGGVYVGLVPGKKISHAIAGADYETPDEDNALTGRNISIVDPARWYGMTATTYPKVYWKKVRPELGCKRKVRT